MTRIIAVVATACFLALQGCSLAPVSPSTPPAGSQPAVALSPAAQVFALKTGYEAPLVLAIAYNRRPPCGVGAPILCRDAAIVTQMRRASDSAMAALDAAEHIARTPGVTSNAIALSIATATHSVKAFEAFVTIYGK